MNPLLEKTSRCVKCGLCLPECPSYQVYATEAYSPRGRINLIQAVARGELKADREVFVRLDTCLQCRRCEKICPSKVDYATILDSGKALLWSQTPGWQKSLAKHISNGTGVAALARLQKFSLKPSPSASTVNQWYAPLGQQQKTVGLFAGCIGKSIDRAALDAAILLLTHSGHRIFIPKQDHCCGALHQHQGNPEQAEKMLAQSQRLFSAQTLDTILVLNPGCTDQLVSNGKFTQPIIEITDYLANNGILDSLQFNPLPKTVALHTPCLTENVLGTTNAIPRLLKYIPALKIQSVGTTAQCCGAGGLHFLTHPTTAKALRTPIVQEIIKLQADYLLSTNVGCALHISRGIKNYSLETLNPVTLLARQLKE